MNARIALVLALVAGSSLAWFFMLSRPAPNARTERAPATKPPAMKLGATQRSERSNSTVWAVSTTPAEAKVEPHPLTAERAAMAEQHELFDTVEELLNAGDVARARQLLQEHERHSAALDDDLRGFLVIADCLEHPGPESRASGEHFVALHRASPLRRKVRHACLGPREPALLE